MGLFVADWDTFTILFFWVNLVNAHVQYAEPVTSPAVLQYGVSIGKSLFAISKIPGFKAIADPIVTD